MEFPHIEALEKRLKKREDQYKELLLIAERNPQPKRRDKNFVHTIYDTTYIYALTIADKCYVGHSTNIHKRLDQHRLESEGRNAKTRNRTLYRTIKDNGGWDMVKYTILKQVRCKNVKEAQVWEQKYYNACFATLNDMQPTGGTPRR